MWVWTAARRQLLLETVLLLPLCYQARPKPVGRIEKTFFPRAKFTRQVFCSFLSAPMWGKSRKHSFNTEIIVYFSISRAWTPHDIFLSDRNDPLWECWYNLSNLTNQRVYQEQWYTGTGCLKKWLQAPPPLLSPVSSHFTFVFTLSQFSGPNYLGAQNRLCRRLQVSACKESSVRQPRASGFCYQAN